MALVKTQDLADAALDWAVGKAEGMEVSINGGRVWIGSKRPFDPSVSWGDGGPIIGREGIATRKHQASGTWYAMALADIGDMQTPNWNEMTARGGERYGAYSYQVHKRRQRFGGPTMLVAAMRCYVASKAGAEVDVPDDLLACSLAL
ncbi:MULTISPECIES: phage protein NinX family protein [unclassified Cupriavidus]|uniref:phage protein NinX family protein n=1 Tax=unclassified Cupriavidus TaxID=2640874 RepID=UPI00313DEC8C